MSWNYTVNGGMNIREYRGKSTDEKPFEDVPNMSIFWEVDTGNMFYFNEDMMAWEPVS